MSCCVCVETIKSRIKRDKPETLAVPAEINQVWSIDFMSDSLKNGSSMRTFNVIDDFNGESLAIDVDLSLPAQRVVRSLQQIIEWRGKPLVLRCYNGLPAKSITSGTKKHYLAKSY